MPIRSPALRLDVVNVGVLADFNRRHGAADVDAVLDHGIFGGERANGELVTDRDVALCTNLDLSVLIHDPAGQVLGGLYAFDDHHTHRVTFIVHNEMNH